MTKNSKKKNPYEKEFLDLYSETKTMSINALVTKFRVSYQEAEDVYQKAYIKAHKKLDTFAGDSSLKTWLYRIIQNLALDYLRKPCVKYEKNSLKLDDEEGEYIKQLSDGSLTPMQVLENKDNTEELKYKIKYIFEKLTDKHRQVLTLVYADGGSYESAAKEMKCSIGTIMSRAFYARKHFIKLFFILEAKIDQKMPLETPFPRC